jgi:capsular exopolysaccharide synthesis family protein
MQDYSKHGRSEGYSFLAPTLVDSRSLETLPRNAPPEGDGGGNLLLDYYRTLLRWRWAIAACALAGAVGGVVINLGALPMYRAQTTLNIQNLNHDFMGTGQVSATADSQSSQDTYVQTQIKLLQSDSLRDRTVKKLRSQPHPAFIERNDLLSQFARSLHLRKHEPLSYEALLSDTAKKVDVKPVGITRLVKLTCDSWDPEFAAKFCNTIVTEFQEQDQEIRGNEALKTSEWLSGQVADVRIKAEESEKKLEEATGGNGLILSKENNSVSEDRLREMQAELLRARADRITKEADYAVSSYSAPDAVPSSSASPIVQEYERKLAELRAKLAELVPPLTEENPKVIHVRAEIRDAEINLARERGSSMGRMKNEYESARQRENKLEAAYAQEERSVSSEMSQSNKVDLLRREVDSEQQLYQTLLQRVKEAGFASAMQVTTMRVVDEATPSKIPFAPRRGNAVVVGLLLGGLAGVGFAFFKERTSDVLRTPGDIEKYLNVRELGVIPTEKSRKQVGRGARYSGAQLGTAMGDYPLDGSHPEPQFADGLDGFGQDANRVDDPIRVTIWNENFSIVAEAYRNATYSLLWAKGSSDRAKVYVVSSPNSGEGKTTVVSNLGVALSESKRRVVLIDGDLRKPCLHRALGMRNDFGLRNLLRGDMNMAEAPLDTLIKKTAIPNLSIITSGSGREEVTSLLHSPRMRELLGRLSREFDVVLIDTPPMLHMADARILAGYSNGVILVFRAGMTSRDQAGTARDLFANDRVRLVGTILNDFDPVKEGKSKYYESYYRYRENTDDTEEAVRY